MGVILTFANGGVKRSAIKGRLALVRLHFGFRRYRSVYVPANEQMHDLWEAALM
jgi:hypothetical protein